MIINKKTQNKKVLITGAIIALVLATSGYLAIAAFAHLPPFAVSEDTSNLDERKVNLERSEAERDLSKSLEENPDLKIQNNQTDAPEDPPQSSTGKFEANILVTNVGISNGMVSASGFVTNVVEEGGSCVYIFTNGSKKLDKSSSTLLNSTSTTCETVRFPDSELQGDGRWDVSITYDSASTHGVSGKSGFTK